MPVSKKCPLEVHRSICLAESSPLPPLSNVVVYAECLCAHEILPVNIAYWGEGGAGKATLILAHMSLLVIDLILLAIFPPSTAIQPP